MFLDKKHVHIIASICEGIRQLKKSDVANLTLLESFNESDDQDFV